MRTRALYLWVSVWHRPHSAAPTCAHIQSKLARTRTHTPARLHMHVYAHVHPITLACTHTHTQVGTPGLACLRGAGPATSSGGSAPLGRKLLPIAATPVVPALKRSVQQQSGAQQPTLRATRAPPGRGAAAAPAPTLQPLQLQQQPSSSGPSHQTTSGAPTRVYVCLHEHVCVCVCVCVCAGACVCGVQCSSLRRCSPAGQTRPPLPTADRSVARATASTQAYHAPPTLSARCTPIHSPISSSSSSSIHLAACRACCPASYC